MEPLGVDFLVEPRGKAAEAPVSKDTMKDHLSGDKFCYFSSRLIRKAKYFFAYFIFRK